MLSVILRQEGVGQLHNLTHSTNLAKLSVYLLAGILFSSPSYSDIIPIIDSDRDGLADDFEDANGNGLVDSNETNFLQADTDRDGFDDGMEVTHGSDPLDADSIPAHGDQSKQACLADFPQGSESVTDSPIKLPSTLIPMVYFANVSDLKLEGFNEIPFAIGANFSIKNIESFNEPSSSGVTGSTINGISPLVMLDDGEQYLFTTNQDGRIRKYTRAATLEWAVDIRRVADDSLSAEPMVQLRRFSNQAFQDRYSSDLVYVATSYSSATRNRIYAINTDTGAIIWVLNLNGNLDIDVTRQGLALDYQNNRLFVATDRTNSTSQSSLWAINTLNGTVDWSANVGQNYGRPLFKNGRVYTSNLFGELNAIDAETGEIIWTTSSGSPHLLGAEIKQMITGEIFIARKDFDGQIRLFRDNGEIGNLVWQTTLPISEGASDAVPVFGLGDQYLYVGGNDGRVYQLSVVTGEAISARTVSETGAINDIAIVDTDHTRRKPTLYAATQNGFITQNCFPFKTHQAAEDFDLDGVTDGADNCPEIENPIQADADFDGLGDLCDLDQDNDFLTTEKEQEIGTNPLLFDTDGDLIPDNLDSCPLSIRAPIDSNGDGAPDTCELGQFSMGGSITGLLANQSLVLQLDVFPTNNPNRQQILTILSSGSFEFDELYFEGDFYQVTLVSSTQQDCVLSNGTGNIQTDNVNNVTITCREQDPVDQEPPEEVDSSGGGAVTSIHLLCCWLIFLLGRRNNQITGFI